MKAINLAKKVYPDMRKEDIMYAVCPDILGYLEIYESCNRNKNDMWKDECGKCWDREVSKEKVNSVIRSAAMCDWMC